MDAGSRIAEARLAMVSEYLDQLATADEPSSGGTLSRAQFRELLANDEDFQTKVAERGIFATPKEKAQLTREVERLLPPEEMLPPSVTDIAPKY